MAYVPVPPALLPGAPGSGVRARACDSFANIPPIVNWADGSACINPDKDHVWKFHLAAKVADASGNLVTEVAILPGEEKVFFLTPLREESISLPGGGGRTTSMGIFRISELLLCTRPFGTGPCIDFGSLKIDIKSLQGDVTYTNASVFDWSIFGDGQLNVCLPKPITLLPTQTIVITIKNFEAGPVGVRITARGDRFMPYHDPWLNEQYTQCVLSDPSIPMWLGLDTLQVEVPASGTASGQISIPGGGFFELFYIRGKVQPLGAAPNAEDVLVNVSEGAVGKRMMNEPIPLNLYMTEDRIVAGMSGGVFRSASASHALGPRQIFKGNTRVIFDFENTFAGGAAFVELAFVGVYHFVSRCPPNADLERVRREAWDGCGDARPDYSCGELPSLPPLPQLPPVYDEYQDAYVPAPVPEPPAPEPLRIVSMWRPSQSYFGPGSAPAIPYQYNYGKDQHGRTHLVVRNPDTNEFVRFATAAEQRPFQYRIDEYNRGLSGLGESPQGEWERI